MGVITVSTIGHFFLALPNRLYNTYLFLTLRKKLWLSLFMYGSDRNYPTTDYNYPTPPYYCFLRKKTLFLQEGEGEQCPHCKCWFTTKSVLSLHMRERHNDRNVNTIQHEIDKNKKGKIKKD